MLAAVPRKIYSYKSKYIVQENVHLQCQEWIEKYLPPEMTEVVGRMFASGTKARLSTDVCNWSSLQSAIQINPYSHCDA